MNRRPLLMVLFFLGLAALACYSDSPLWPYELTPAPPTVTPLPIPDRSQTRFQIGDLAYVPSSVTEAAFRLDLTRFPEPLKPDLSNKSPQACSQNSVVQILYSGIDASGEVYQLVDCGGTAGWTTESRLLGPIDLILGNRALTVEGGLDESGAYKIILSDPPFRENDPFQQKGDCRLGDTVDIVAMYGLSTGELYYKIRCENPLNPIVPNLGWVAAEGLFGPVRFRNGEIGLVPENYESIELTSEADGGEVVGICQRRERLQITQTPVVRLGDAFYYELICEQATGWAEQSQLVGPVGLGQGQRMLVTVPAIADSAQITSDIEATPEADSTAEALPIITALPLTNEPGPFSTDSHIGECPDSTLIEVKDLAGVDGLVYAQVDCEGILGWLEAANLYGPVSYTSGESVQLGEKALLGFNERGLYLSVRVFDIEGSSGGSGVIAGECAFNFETQDPIEAEVLEIGYYRTSTGAVVGVFYRVACINPRGERIEGWINQDRIGAE